MRAEALIAFEAINVFYGKNHVLRDLSLHANEGEVVALIGPNAAGKTTTLRTALGLKAPVSGTIRFAGSDITKLSTSDRVRLGLVLVPEGRQVFPQFSVWQNLQMGAYPRKDRNDLAGDLEYVFGVFPRLKERREQKAGSMSGGEQQMLAIARGYMSKPRCLLLDEPTLGLAPIMVEEIIRIVQALAQTGITIVLAEQNAAMALDTAARAYVLEAGAISLDGEASALEQSDAVRSLYLGT